MTVDSLREILRFGEKVNTECKEARSDVPRSVYASYSAFANTYGGTVLLGVAENQDSADQEQRFTITGVVSAQKIITDFWNTINSNKVSANILIDENVYAMTVDDCEIVVIEIPRADYNTRPVYVGENPFKGTYKRNHEGDYHCTEAEVRAMIRDENPDGNDSMIIEGYTMDDIDPDTLRSYRQNFRNMNINHVWEDLDDKTFLENLGGYRIDRKNRIEGLTMAGLLMFGKGLAVRDAFATVFMDYREETDVSVDVRWNDRITYDGMWENNLYNFYMRVVPKLISDIKRPFKLEGMQRVDDTPIHKAIREAFVNAIIHADFLTNGTLKVIKTKNGFRFTNPGVLQIEKEQIYKGGVSKARNPKMQNMFRMIGLGDNIGSGFPSILAAWQGEGWVLPELTEDAINNEVTLTLTMEKTTSQNPDVGINVGINVGIKMTKTESLVFQLLVGKPDITSDEIAEQLKVTRRTVERNLESLKKKGIIERIGSKKNGYWKIIKIAENGLK